MKKNTLLFVSLLLLVSCNRTITQEARITRKLDKLIASESPSYADVVNLYHKLEKGERKAVGEESSFEHYEQWIVKNAYNTDNEGKVISNAQQIREAAKKIGIANLGHWYCVGPIDVARRSNKMSDGGRVRDLLFDPSNPQRIYVCCFEGGFWRTDDMGLTWTPLFNDVHAEIRAASLVNNTPSTIYLATDKGIYQSVNSGQTWNRVSTLNAWEILVNQNNDVQVLAGTSTGIYRSVNGGVNWVQVKGKTSTDINNKFTDIVAHPTNPTIFYATTNKPGGFFKSTDGGATWVEKSAGFTVKESWMRLAVTPLSPDKVFVIQSRTATDSFEGFYVSIDAGESFVKKSSQSPCIVGYSVYGALSQGQPNYNLFVTVHPDDDNIIYAGGIYGWKSTDGGVNWTCQESNMDTQSNMHMDQLDWQFHPTTKKIVYGSDGGFFAENASGKFESRTNGLSIAECHGLGMSMTDRDFLGAGTMHCGIHMRTNGKWYTPSGGDEAHIVIDYTDPKYVYHMKKNFCTRSVNSGVDFANIDNNLFTGGLYNGVGELDTSDPNILIVGKNDLWRNSAARTGKDWTQLSTNGSTSITAFRQSISNRDVAYYARETALFSSSDFTKAAPVFTPIPAPSTGIINDIQINSKDPATVYVAQGTRIYKSTNSGTSWVSITANLPLLTFTCLALDTSSVINGMYAACDQGVYYRDDTMSNWVWYSSGLPAVAITGMNIYYDKDRLGSLLTVATNGRGIYRTVLYGVEPQLPVADFATTRTDITTGSVVSYTDISANYPNTYSWNFSGGTPSTSSDKNPIVTYNTPGTYSVALTVKNGAGENVVQKNSLITVTDVIANDLKVEIPFTENLLDYSNYKHATTLKGTLFVTPDAQRGNVGDLNAGQLELTGYKGALATTPRTIAVWIKTTTAAKVICSSGSGSYGMSTLRVADDGTLRFEIGGGYVEGTTVLTDNNWHHVAMTFSGISISNNVELYVDGKRETEKNQLDANLYTKSGLDLTIGVDAIATRAFVGFMSRFYYYEKALSALEITQLYTSTSTAVDKVSENNDYQVFVKNQKIHVKSLLDNAYNVRIFDANAKLVAELTNQYGESELTTTGLKGTYFAEITVNAKRVKIGKVNL